VVQKADILRQRLFIGAGKRADQRVGCHHAAHEVAGHRTGDRVPDRSTDQRLPCSLRFGAAADDVPTSLLASAQRFGERRPQGLGHQPAPPVEVGETVLVGFGADSAEGAARPDQQAGASAKGRIGGVGRIAAPHQLNACAQVLDDVRRQQADQVRVARKPRIHAVEGAR